MNVVLLKLLWERRKKIIQFSIISAIFFIIISFIISPRFKSTAVIYPANLGSLSDETPTDQLMQFLNSIEVKEKINKKLNLIDHYEIKADEPFAETEYFDALRENILIDETKYGSIEITVFDKDPVMAQRMFYSLLESVNEHIKESKNKLILEYLKSSYNFLNSRRKKMDSVDVLLRDFNQKFGINNYNEKIGNATKYFYKSIPEGRSDALSKKIDELELQGIEEQWKERKTKVWSELFRIYLGDYNASLQEFDKGIKDLEREVSYTIIASKPNLPEKKDSPKRALIIIVGTLASSFIYCLYFIIKEKVLKIKELIMN